MLLLSIHAREETWKPGRYQTKAQLADREPQVSFEPSQDFSNEDYLNQYNLKVTGMWRGGNADSSFWTISQLLSMLTATIPLVIRFNDARLIDPTKSFKKKNPASREDPSGQRHEHARGLRPTAPVESDVDNKRADVLCAMLCSSSYTERSHTKPSFLSLC